MSFRREAHVPRGGPDGGDGGCGGNVVLATTSRHNTLYPFQFKRHFKAENGTHGQGKRKTGRMGRDVIIEIPPGTLVHDADTGTLIKDFTQPGERFVVAEGGLGGRGNARFRTATHRTPRFAQPGEPGRTIRLTLELKLIAEVGIIGLPNAGKSTLIRAVSSAHPKIGDYPFTTLSPNLGVVQLEEENLFVVADIPGLIQGAHEGAGLGFRFLRHIERTRMLIHLIDGSTVSLEDPLCAYNTVNRELRLYNKLLAEKPQIVVINKMDLPGVPPAAERFKAAIDTVKVLPISAQTGEGVQELLLETRRRLEEIRE